MNEHDFNDNEEPGFLKKYGFIIGLLVVLLVVGGLVASAYLFTGKVPPPRKPAEITVSLPPPPPPPPPPPTPPPPKIPPPPDKMIVQTPVKPNEEKPKDVVKAPDKAPGPPGKPSGPASDDGISTGGGGGGTIGGGTGGSRFGWYGGKVQTAVHQALDHNSQTRQASFRHLRIRVWIDQTGLITRAVVSGSSGDATVDNALANQAFRGVRLSEPPPADMPMPIVMNIDAERPK